MMLQFQRHSTDPAESLRCLLPAVRSTAYDRTRSDGRGQGRNLVRGMTESVKNRPGRRGRYTGKN